MRRLLSSSGSRLRDMISRKLGRCPRCMRSCARGMCVSWVMAAAIVAIAPYPLLLAPALVVAVSFTLLLLAHLVAVTVRVARMPEGSATGEDASTQLVIGRRGAAARLGQAALWTAVFGLGLFWPARKAQAQSPSPTPGMCETQGAFTANVPASTNVAANNENQAVRMMCEAAANAHCSPFSSSSCPFCKLKGGQGALSCTVTCTPAPGQKKLFNSTAGTVTARGCECGTR